MSVSITNLFNYARSLPSPFDTRPGKKVKVSSKYSHGTEATLCASVIKAVNAACCMNSGGEGAIGTVGEHKYAAEYKSSASTDTFHIVVYESVSGNIVASVYDRSTESCKQKSITKTKKSPTKFAELEKGMTKLTGEKSLHQPE